MVFFYLTILLRTVLTEGRVFCEDPNATPWKALGFSCPLQCENVVTIIEKLKAVEYRNILNKEIEQSATLIQNYLRNETGNQNNLKSLKIQRNGIDENTYNENLHDKIYWKKKTFNFKKGLRNINIYLNETIKLVFQRQAMKLKQSTQSRKDFDVDFLTIMTTILNKFANPEYKFTDDLTLLLLRKILGKNMDLRYGVFNIPKMLRELHLEIKKMKSLKLYDRQIGVKLTSKHCLNVYVPGCYCNSGYVEKAGQCVEPAQCLTDSWQHEYLNRITFS